MHRSLFVTTLAISAATAARCGGQIPSDLTPGQIHKRQVQQVDSNPLLGTYEREYTVQLPKGYTGKERLPVLFYFHGWGDDLSCSGCHFRAAANNHNFILVKPNGMTDGQDAMRSWNVGQAGRTDICNHQDVEEMEYTSCLTAGTTSICNCGTCYDDVKFVADIAASLQQELCIDDDRVFATGGSYGGLFDYFLAPALLQGGHALRLRGILPWYGGFYKNMLDVPQSMAGTSAFHFHGIHDKEVPMDDSESGDGYYYVPTNVTLKRFAEINGCAEQESSIATAWDGQGDPEWKGPGGSVLLGCVEWKGCATGGRVVRCDFDGAHGIWPPYAEELMWSFFGSLGQVADEASV